VPPLQCINFIVRTIWQQLHAHKMTNDFKYFRHWCYSKCVPHLLSECEYDATYYSNNDFNDSL